MQANKPIWIDYFLCIPIPHKQTSLFQQWIPMSSNSIQTKGSFENEFQCIPIPCKRRSPSQSIASYVFQCNADSKSHLHQFRLLYYPNLKLSRVSNWKTLIRDRGIGRVEWEDLERESVVGESEGEKEGLPRVGRLVHMTWTRNKGHTALIYLLLGVPVWIVS